jgi:hypothetical protein
MTVAVHVEAGTDLDAWTPETTGSGPVRGVYVYPCFYLLPVLCNQRPCNGRSPHLRRSTTYFKDSSSYIFAPGFSQGQVLARIFFTTNFHYHVDVPYWLASRSSVHRITASSPTHSLMRALYKSCQTPPSVTNPENGSYIFCRNIGKPWKFDADLFRMQQQHLSKRLPCSYLILSRNRLRIPIHKVERSWNQGQH